MGGSGGNTAPIAGNPGVSTRAITTTVDSGAGNDEVHLTGNTGGANLVIQGHSGLDTVTIGDASHNMQGLIADVYIDNTSGATNLIIDDAGDTTGRIFSINNGLIVGLGSSIGLSPPKITHSLFALNSLTVLGGSGGNTIHVVFNANVSSRAVLTTVNSGAGNDTVSVQSTSGNGGASVLIQGNAGLDTVTISDANRTTQGIGGALNIDNTSGATNLILDDSGDTLPRTVTINNGTILGLAPATISHSLFAINSMTILGGSGGNTLNVEFNANVSGRAITTTIDSGTGNDTVNVHNLSGNGGASLAIFGQAGADQVNIGDASHLAQGIGGAVSLSNAAGFTNLTIDDAGDSFGHSMFVSGTGVSGLTPAAITYDRSIVSVTINAGTASDTFHVTPAASTSFTLNGGAPPPRALPGDTLDVNLAATTGVSNTDTLTAAGH